MYMYLRSFRYLNPPAWLSTALASKDFASGASDYCNAQRTRSNWSYLAT